VFGRIESPDIFEARLGFVIEIKGKVAEKIGPLAWGRLMMDCIHSVGIRRILPKSSDSCCHFQAGVPEDGTCSTSSVSGEARPIEDFHAGYRYGTGRTADRV